MQVKTKLVVFLFVLFVLAFSLLVIPNSEYEAAKYIAVVTVIWAVFFVFLHRKRYDFLGLNAFLVFSAYVVAHRLTFHGFSGFTLVVYAAVAMTLTFIYILLFQTLSKRLKFFPTVICAFLNILVFSIPIVYIIYFLYFKVGMSPDVIRAILQTNIHEAIGFLNTYLDLRWAILILFVTAVSSYGLYRQEKKNSPAIKAGLTVSLILVLSIILYVNKADLLVLHYTYTSTQTYEQELKQFQELLDKRKAADTSVIATKHGQNEVYVVVIGESLNKMHMGIYGYPRDTTPLLQNRKTNGELLIFRNAFAIHTHTMEVLSLALTEANLSNKENYFESVSILETLAASNVETWWVTNQMLYGLYDNFVTVLAQNADQLVALNENVGPYTKTQHHDGQLLDQLKSIINSDSSNNRVIFVHLMGSHWPYCDRYPPEFEIFQGNLEKEIFGKLSGDEVLRDMQNCYDNTVVYNDYVINSVLTSLQNAKAVSGLLYFSDHADDVFEKKGHHSDKFTFSMTQIPFLAWFSDSYKDRYPQKFQNLVTSQNEFFSNDFFYDTLLGLTGVQTDKYESGHDLSNEEYFLDPQEASVLDGTKKYATAENVYYQQSRNLAGLKQNGLLSKVGIFGAETLGKLAVASDYNIENFKVGSGLDENSTLTIGDEENALQIANLISANFANRGTSSFLLEILPSNTVDREFTSKVLASLSNHNISESEILIALPFQVGSIPEQKNYDYPLIYRITGGDIAVDLSTSKKQSTEISPWIEELINRQASGLLINSGLYPAIRVLMDQVPTNQRIPIYIQATEEHLQGPEFLENTQHNAYWEDPEVSMIMVGLLTPYDM